MISIESILKLKPEFRGSFINGRWTKSQRPSGTWEAISPANIDWVLPPVSFSFDHVAEAVDAGRKAFKVWARMGLHTRVEKVTRFGAELKKRSEVLARVLAMETGKPLAECLAETDLLQTKINATIEHGLALIKSQVIELGVQGVGEIHFRPKGLIAVLGPFNLALSLPHGQIIPALLSGNTCVFKPSDKTPHSAQLYIEAAEAAEFPPGVIQMVQGRAETGIRLVRDMDVDGIFATCSFDVGTQIQKELAENPQRIVALEMGAKNSALVLNGFELESCADAVVKSAFMTTGQRCTALSRVFVERPHLEALVKRVHELTKELVISQPFDENPTPFMGPLISATAKERFFRYVAIAEGENAEAIMRPKSLDGSTRLSRRPLPVGHYTSPSINLVQRWDPKSAYQTHEIFGPDVFFCPVDSIEEGIAAVNSTGYGLAFSMFGGSEDAFRNVADHVEAGLVYWNRGTVGSSSRLPFGGWKKSGNHRPSGIFGIYSATQVQSRIRAKS